MATGSNLKVELVPIDKLHAHPRNPRQGDVGAISESLQAHGLYKPLVVQRSTGYILAGNHTWQAASALGWKEISVVYSDVNDDDALRILLVDNRTSDRSSYDNNELADLLTDMAESPRGLEGVGWDGDDLDALLRALEYATRAPLDPTAEWGGMPAFDQQDRLAAFSVSISFPSETAADDFFKLINRPKRAKMWWPTDDGHVGSTVSEEWIADA